MAAKQAVVEYSTENLLPPILTIEDAIQQNSYIQMPPFLAPKPVGDYSQGMSEADHKILSADVHSSPSWSSGSILSFQRDLTLTPEIFVFAGKT